MIVKQSTLNKLKPHQFDKMEKSVNVSGVFTITAIFLGEKPTLVIRVDEINMVTVKIKKKPVVVF